MVIPFTVTAVTLPKSVPVRFKIVPVTPVNGENDVTLGGKHDGGGGFDVFKLFVAPLPPLAIC